MDKCQQQLVAILKSSLFDSKLRDFSLSKRQWEQVYKLSKRGGVTAIAYNAICKLPQEYRPEQGLFIRWTSRYHNSIERFNKRKNAYNALCRVIEAQNLQGIVFKGLTISNLYPVPELREFGDIDIFLYGDYDENENKLHDGGLTSQHPSKRHSHIRINNVLIENHHHILFNHNSADHLLDIWLREQGNQSTEKIGAFNVLPPLAKAVQFIMHTGHHFTSNDCNIRIRTITDWAMFIRQNNFDYAELREKIAPAGAANLLDALTLTVNDWFQCVPKEMLAHIPPMSKGLLSLFEKAVFDKNFQRKDEKSFLKRMFGHLRKSIVYVRLKQIKLKY